jgi:AbrB family looped-hinge helix DNA binding protein
MPTIVSPPVRAGKSKVVIVTISATRLRPRGSGRDWLSACHFHGILQSMRVALDSAGRIVVPKALRQALGLKPGQALEIRAGDGRLEIEIAPTAMRLKKRGKSVVAVPEAALPALTAEQVRETLERVRR